MGKGGVVERVGAAVRGQLAGYVGEDSGEVGEGECAAEGGGAVEVSLEVGGLALGVALE